MKRISTARPPGDALSRKQFVQDVQQSQKSPFHVTRPTAQRDEGILRKHGPTFGKGDVEKKPC
jgi:hypothetical protein